MANILVISTASIAAVKTPDLVSQLKKRGHNVTCVLTESAQNFVTADSLSYLSGNKTHVDMFDAADENKMAHISLARENDLIVVAPASADFLAKMAHGFCNDLASTICLATDKEIIAAPAMNTVMYKKPATQRNIKTLKSDGVFFIEPEKGTLACGEKGVGRMAEVERIITVIESKVKNIENQINLKGLKCLVTSGPTRENIDPVRYISNHSSGKQGYAIAESLAKYGAEVNLVSGPTTIDVPDNVNLIPVESALEMMDACRDLLPVDVAICAAAVADWKPSEVPDQKIKKQKDIDSHMLTLIENPDILYEISRAGAKRRPSLVIGFAAETEHLVENAMVKLERKGCDWIVANNVAEDDVFNSDENSVHIISSDGVLETIVNQKKTEVADRLSRLVSDHFYNDKIAFLNAKNKQKK